MSIYALVDPRTDEIRYVGKSKDPSARFRQHVSSVAGRYVAKWVSELKRAGAGLPHMWLTRFRREGLAYKELRPDLNFNAPDYYHYVPRSWAWEREYCEACGVTSVVKVETGLSERMTIFEAGDKLAKRLFPVDAGLEKAAKAGL